MHDAISGLIVGKYILEFYTGSDLTVPSVRMPVNIVPCPVGWVTTGGRKDTCNRCPEGLYSFDSVNTQCNICVPNFQCPGEATVWPEVGFWHSAPRSIQAHR
jgi:hypothetical protein